MYASNVACISVNTVFPSCMLGVVHHGFQNWKIKSDVSLVVGSNNSLRWRHNGRDSVSNHQPHDCLLNRLFRRRSKKTSKFPAQVASNAENIAIWRRHHVDKRNKSTSLSKQTFASNSRSNGWGTSLKLLAILYSKAFDVICHQWLYYLLLKHLIRILNKISPFFPKRPTNNYSTLVYIKGWLHTLTLFIDIDIHYYVPEWQRQYNACKWRWHLREDISMESGVDWYARQWRSPSIIIHSAVVQNHGMKHWLVITWSGNMIELGIPRVKWYI